MPDSPDNSETRVEDFRKTFDFHRAHPDVSFDEHVRQKRITLGASLADLHPIYLDTCYWIFIRDAFMGRPISPVHAELLNVLRNGVKANRIFCPISDTTLVELLKRVGPERKAVITLVDELSLGVTFAPEDERVGTELAYFLNSTIHPQGVYPLKWLVWNRVVYTLGVSSPSLPWLDEAETLVIQKAFFDHLWDFSLSEVMETAGFDKEFPRLPLDELAQKLTSLNQQYSEGLRSYKQIYQREIWGAVELVFPKASKIIDSILKRTEVKREISIQEVKDRLLNAAKKLNIAQALPTLHVMAHCHASIRHDKKRPLKANDIPDFHHASAALVHCKAFFTEKPLHLLLTSPHAQLDKAFNCNIISDCNEAVNFLYAEKLCDPLTN